jgi:tRNA(Ile)-lysidine synthase
MENEFNAYLENRKLLSPKDKVLLGVSGGMDSMVMMLLFHRAGIPIGIAHCNFQLRGSDSDADETLAKRVSAELGAPCYTKHFDTEAYKKRHSVSTQEAARDLRRQWFEETRKKYGYNKIALAHHQDDSIETFFINLVRGTGLTGLRGILPKKDNVIRPLLFATRSEIHAFVKKEGLAYREDQSNEDPKYRRNKLRHQVIPVLKEINPGFVKTMMGNIDRLYQAEMIYRETLDNKIAHLIEEIDDSFRISIAKLKEIRPTELYLFEALRPFNFNAAVCRELLKSLETTSGKKFFSPTHIAIKDREHILINKIQEPDGSSTTGKINKEDGMVFSPIKLSVNQLTIDAVDIRPDPMTANLDGDKLTYPLVVRRWEHGDSFYPLGMNGKKKLSDFFIDLKVPISQKDNIFVLESEGQIAWIIGFRLDNRYKISSRTQNVHLFEYSNGT